MNFVDFRELRSREDERLMASNWVASLEAAPAEGQDAPADAPVVARGSGKVLRILQREGALPPLIASHVGVGVIFDGVLHNRVELRAGLGSVSAPLANDASLVLQAYLQRGGDVISKLRGAFALILFDGRRDYLLYARDPIGVHPLFYSDTGRELLMSSSVHGLLQHSRASGTLNRVAIADHLASRWPYNEETFYESIKRVPQGHAVRIEGGQRQEYRYWDPAPPGSDVNWIREDELGQFDVLLDQAVNRCLDLGPAAIYLSGGLDSVSVAAVATDCSRQRGMPLPFALSLDFPYGDEAEANVQRGAAAKLGLSQVMVPLDEVTGSTPLLDVALEMSPDWAMPMVSLWRPAYQILAQEGVRRGCRVVLTGAGGDEWLTASPSYTADLIRAFDMAGLYRLMSSFIRSHPLRATRVARMMLWQFGARPVMARMVRRLLEPTAPGVLMKYRKQRAVRSRWSWIAPDPGLMQQLAWREDQTMIRRSGRLDDGFYLPDVRSAIEHPLVSMELEDTFEADRRSGLRQLAPYWDADLVDFLYRTPPELLFRGGRSKGLVRHMLSDRFPELGFDRQKKRPATTVLGLEFKRDGRLAWERMGGARALAELGIVEPKGLSAVVEGYFSGTRPQTSPWLIYQVLNLEAWIRPRMSSLTS
jgi:asparagine synthase (glutamine-hydrolysing)